MKLSDYIDEERVICSLSSGNKDDVLKEMVEFLNSKGVLENAQLTLSALTEREKLGSTGVGEEIAIPHAKLSDMDDLVIMIAISREGVDFDSVDGKDVKIFFLVLAPEKQMNLHLKTLARISRLVKITDFKDRVLSVSGTAEICAVLEEEEAKL
jgi:PTS system nitrogen regulatory IIA component